MTAPNLEFVSDLDLGSASTKRPRLVVPRAGLASDACIDPTQSTVIFPDDCESGEVRPLAESVLAILARDSNFDPSTGVSLPPDDEPPPAKPLPKPVAAPIPKPPAVPSAKPHPSPTVVPPQSPAHMAHGSAVGAGRYLIDGKLGEGGMGTVLQVFDQDLRRRVAMKVLNPSAKHAPGADLLERFIEEAQVSSQLQHPNIMPVYDIGLAEGGYVYYTMKLVGGRSFQEILDQPRMKPRDGDAAKDGPNSVLHERLAIFDKIVSAVAYAHSKGVVHRDLKPENVMVGRFGEVLVMDWGLAKVLPPAGAPLPPPAPNLSGEIGSARGDKFGPIETVRTVAGKNTVAGAIAGTPAFMAPEQARGESARIDARTDVWALGAILYAILIGHPPHHWGHARGNLPELLRRAREDRVRPPSANTARIRVPGALAAIAMKALAFDPADRYADAGELMADLQRFEAGDMVLASTIARWLRAVQAAWRSAGSLLATAFAPVMAMVMR